MEHNYGDSYEPSRWQRARRRFKSFGLWFGGAIGLGGIVAAYFGSVATELLPAPRDLFCLAKEQLREPSPGTHFTILISDLANDSNGQQTDLVRNVFLNQRALDVRRTCRVVTLESAGGSLADAEAAATAAGRALLDDWNADILIWGEVIEWNKQLHLWFLTREEDARIRQPSYSVTETINLPIDFQKDVAEQIEAVAFSQMQFNEDQLDSTLEKLRHLISWDSDGPFQPPRTALLYAFGRAAAARGVREFDRNWLEEAVAAYQRVLQNWTRERVSLGWAAAEQSLADALAILGMLELDQGRLKQALTFYGESLTEWDEAQVLPRVSAIRFSIGTTLGLLGTFQADQNRHEEAAVSYRDALKGLSIELAPYDWAAAQTALGDTFVEIGMSQAVPARLQEAMDAYRQALRVWTHEQWPTEWANTQLRIGEALRAAAVMSDDPAYLREALDLHDRVLDLFGRDRQSVLWKKTELGMAEILFMMEEWNLGRARLQNVLAEQQPTFWIAVNSQSSSEMINPNEDMLEIISLIALTGDVDSLEDMIALMRSNLAKEKRQSLFDWTGHIELAIALGNLGRLKGDESSFKLAITELRAALETVAPGRAPGLWAVTQAALGDVLTAIAEMQDEPEQLSEGIGAYQQALEIITRERAPDVWSNLQRGLGGALTTSGWLERNPDTLREAVATFKISESEFRGRHQLERALHHVDIGKAWTRLGELERDSMSLHEGISAFERALKEAPRTHLPLDWAIIQGWLSNATLALEELERVPLGLLEERIETLREALDVFQKAGTEYYIVNTEAKLARGEALLAERRRRSAAE